MNLISRYLAIGLVLSPFFAFGQNYPLLSTYEGDTVLIFSIEQGRYLTKSNEERKYYAELVRECEQEVVVQKDIINAKGEIIHNLELQKDDLIIIVQTKEELNLLCEQENELLRKEVKKQKRQKVIAIISGSVLTLLGLIIAI